MRFPILHISFLPAAGMALFPFILVKRQGDKLDKVLINHERIHLIQQMELLIVFFYPLYLLNYFYNLLKYRSHAMAYMNIAFEREAYLMEKNISYIKTRRFWQWIRYL